LSVFDVFFVVISTIWKH